MRVAYVTPYYNGECDGRFGRFHDWIHTARDAEEVPFEFDVYPFTSSNDDSTLVVKPHKFLGEATELWGTKWNKVEFLLNTRKVRRALRASDYDIIHVLVMDTIVLPTVLSLRSDTPLIVGPDIAGWSPIREGMFKQEAIIEMVKNRLKYGMKRTFGRHIPYDRAIAFSEHHRDILTSFCIPDEKIRVIPGGVANRFSVPESTEVNTPPEILWVGDFNHHKGYYHFLEALTRVDREVTARLIGAGDPDDEQIDSLGLHEDVIVEGFVPRSELPEYYQHADLHVVPSIDETAGPNTQLEALASGTPVVVTDKKGIHEYAREHSVVPFWPRDADALTQALEEALDRLDHLNENAKLGAEAYRAEKTVQALHEIYSELA